MIITRAGAHVANLRVVTPLNFKSYKIQCFPQKETNRDSSVSNAGEVVQIYEESTTWRGRWISRSSMNEVSGAFQRLWQNKASTKKLDLGEN